MTSADRRRILKTGFTFAVTIAVTRALLDLWLGQAPATAWGLLGKYVVVYFGIGGVLWTLAHLWLFPNAFRPRGERHGS
jgi:hypothetical protein